MIIIKIIRWLFGALFAIAVLVYFSQSILLSFFSGLLAILLIPPLERFVMRRLNLNLPTIVKVIIGIILVFMIGAVAPKSQTSSQSTQIPSPTVKLATVQETLTPTKAKSNLYAVTSVIDGDTIQVTIDGKKETIRLIGINSPETVDPRKPVECFGKEASVFAKSKLTGKSVQLEADSTQGERDKYKRLLRYVFLEDGTNFGKLMISDGYAYEDTYDLPYKYQAEFKKAQKDAETAKKGLWADNACETSAPQVTPTSSATTGGSNNPGASTGDTVAPTASSGGSGGYSCAGKTTCGQMSSCAEAQFYLSSCGVSSLDRDGDGVPCETLC